MSRKLLHVVLSFVLLMSALVLIVGHAGAALVWQPLSGDAIALNLEDDDSQEVPLGFTFDFYEISHTHVFVNSNGNLTFGAANPGGGGYPFFVTGPIPDDPNTIVAPLCDELANDLLGGLQAVLRLKVKRGHAARDIHRQHNIHTLATDDLSFTAGLGPGHRHDQ